MSGGTVNLKFTLINDSDQPFPNTKPDGTDDPEGRQKNCRVEIRIEK
ncbi:MAG TPA: hypothetical protein VM616_05245 [Gammaproteobacteria bacterium]|nr:hypothetical protein [Gammaproteobacteria bacterium]